MKRFFSLILSLLFLWNFTFLNLCPQVFAETGNGSNPNITKFDSEYYDYRFVVLNGKFQRRYKDSTKYTYVINTENENLSNHFLKKLNEDEVKDLGNINPELYNKYKHVLTLHCIPLKKGWDNYFEFINTYNIEDLEPLNGLVFYSDFGEKMLKLMRKTIENGWWNEYCEIEELTGSGGGFYTRNEKRTIQRITLFLIMKKQGYSFIDIKNGVNALVARPGGEFKYKLTVNNKTYKDFSKINIDDINENTLIKLNNAELGEFVKYIRTDEKAVIDWTKENFKVFNIIKNVDYIPDKDKLNILTENFGDKVFGLNAKYYHTKSVKVKKVINSKKIPEDKKLDEIKDRLNVSPIEYIFTPEIGFLLLSPILLPIGIVLLPVGIIAFVWFMIEKGKYQ